MEKLLPCIFVMACLARMSGGWNPFKIPDKLSFIPEALFGLCIGLAVWYNYGPSFIWLGFLSFVWSYAWMETGHGTALTMGMDPSIAKSGRTQTLSPVVDWICNKIGAKLGGFVYSWIFFAVKGFLIGVPLFPYGILLGLFWPMGYTLGAIVQHILPEKYRYVGGSVKELASGACAGYCIYLFSFG